MKRKVWALFLLALAGYMGAQPPTTTTYVGTVKDLTGATVTSGRITWQLNAPQGGVIPGTGSFVSTTVSCSINASGHPVSTTDGTSPCLITNNTALTPTGTSYTMCTQPQFVSPGSCIVTYAPGGTVDISTIVPVPTTGPFNYAGTPGPPGPIGATGATGATGPAGAPYTGVTEDGASGIVVTGSVAAKNAVSANGQNIAPDPHFNGFFVAGDSFSSCNGVTVQANCWNNLSSAYINGTYTNKAVSGSLSTDAVTQVLPFTNPTYFNNGPLYALETGGNDTSCGVTTGCEANFSAAMNTLVSWLGIPNESKILFGTNVTAVSTTGTWTQDSTFQTNLGLQTIVPGSTLTFTAYNSATTMYLAWMVHTAATASASLSCNGGALTDTLPGGGFNAPTAPGTLSTTALGKRYNLSAGIATCTITVTTAGAGNPFGLVYAAFPTGAPNMMSSVTLNAPRVVTFGMVYNTNLAGGDRDAGLAAYDVLLYGLVSQWKADGIFATYIPMRTPNPSGVPGYLDKIQDFGTAPLTLPNGQVCPASTGPGHPNDCGHRHMRDAFLQAVKPLLYTNSTWPATVANMDQNATTSSTLPASNQLMPGLNYSSLGVGNSTGMAFARNAAGAYSMDSFMKNASLFGWRWCTYPAGTPLATPSQYSFCDSLPAPVANATLLTDLAAWPPTVTNMDGNTHATVALPAGSNTFTPGFNIYSGGAGASVGMAMKRSAGGVYSVDNFAASNWAGGWNWCVYPVGTPLATPSIETFCTNMPIPTANATLLTDVAAWPPTVASMDANTSSAKGTAPATNAFLPGVNVYAGGVGASTGSAIKRETGGLYWADYFTTSVVAGWSWCVYPSGTPLATPSQETFCYRLPIPTANMTIGTYAATLTTTGAASDTLTVTGMTATGHCSLTATNAAAATNIATTYISAKAANQITVTHTATAGLVYDAICTAN